MDESEIRQTGPTTFCAAFCLKLESERQKGPYKPRGKYFCAHCMIHTDGMLDAPEEARRRCPICRKAFF